MTSGYAVQPFAVLRHTAQQKHVFRQTTEPTTAEGVVVDDLWMDATNHLVKRCTAITPAVTFVSIEVGADTIKDSHIDWGSGAGQVDADDVPESATKFWADSDGLGANDSIKAAMVDWGAAANQIDADDVPESATKKWAAETGADVTGSHAPQAHAASHVAGDAIQSATAAQAGLATAAQITKLDGIEALADVTDATNVEAAGAAMVAGDIYSGVHDFGGATSLEVPNGAGGTTVDATGEVCIDSTSKTVNFYDGAAEAVLNPTITKSLVILAPVATDDFPIYRTDVAITLVEVHYVITGATNWVGQLQECDANGANGADTQAADSTATTTDTEVTSFSNASIDAGDYIGIKTTSISDTPTALVVTFSFRQNA